MKLIIFDLGKVLIDYDLSRISTKFHSLTKLKSIYSRDYIHNLLFNYEDGLTNLYDKGMVTDEEFFTLIKDKFQLELNYNDFIPIWNNIFYEMPEMKDTVSKLKNSYPLYILSNVNSLHFNYIKDRFDILDLIDEMILSYQVKTRKPEKEIYDIAVKKSGFSPSEILFIDDREINIDSARKLGMKGFVFNFSTFKDDLNKFIGGHTYAAKGIV